VHELAIAESIVTAVEREIERQKLSSVNSVVLRIGVLSDIVPEALAFNFEAITRDTLLENASLIIEQVPLRGRCQACLAEFEIFPLS
jgi:hydrogenase nickel incorporation protein HypA/HybF